MAAFVASMDGSGSVRTGNQIRRDDSLKGDNHFDSRGLSVHELGHVMLCGLLFDRAATNVMVAYPDARTTCTGTKVLCSGKDGGVVVPGALIARGEYAEQNPENVAKFLAVYLRAWKWMGAHKPEAMAMMKKFYEQGGVSISEASMKKEFDTRPTFDLATQIARMDRSRGNSDMDAWFGQIGIFMRGTGAIQTIPQSGDYITDAFMKRVQADPKLREFANRSN